MINRNTIFFGIFILLCLSVFGLLVVQNFAVKKAAEAYVHNYYGLVASGRFEDTVHLFSPKSKQARYPRDWVSTLKTAKRKLGDLQSYKLDYATLTPDEEDSSKTVVLLNYHARYQKTETIETFRIVKPDWFEGDMHITSFKMISDIVIE